jgi:hypothetical protein
LFSGEHIIAFIRATSGEHDHQLLGDSIVEAVERFESSASVKDRFDASDPAYHDEVGRNNILEQKQIFASHLSSIVENINAQVLDYKGASNFQQIASAETIPSNEATCIVCGDEHTDNAPVAKQECGHGYCEDCLTGQLNAGLSGKRLAFNYLCCAGCRRDFVLVMVPEFVRMLTACVFAEHLALKETVRRLALAKFNEEGTALITELKEKKRLPVDRDATPEELSVAALETMAIYSCVECLQPFCGGRISCSEDMEMDASDMRCQSCTWTLMASQADHRCFQHGYKHAVFKCDSCCAVANWDCGWHHYCERCHGQASQPKNYPCPGPEKCPLGLPHPPNQAADFGKANDTNFQIPFVVGCLVCAAGVLEENENSRKYFEASFMWDLSEEKKAAARAKEEQHVKKEAALEPEVALLALPSLQFIQGCRIRLNSKKIDLVRYGARCICKAVKSNCVATALVSNRQNR